MTTSEQSGEQSRGLPFWLDSNPPVLDDPLDATSPKDWLPANKPTEHLLRIWHVLADVQACLDAVKTANGPKGNLRARRDLTVKACVLSAEIDALRASLDEWRKRPEMKAFVLACRGYKKKIRPHLKSLTEIRNKLGAHYDKMDADRVRRLWEQVRTCDMVRPLLLMLALVGEALFPDVYAWSRRCSDGDHWCLMSVDGMVAHLIMKGGKPEMIGGVTSCRSPKLAVGARLAETAALVRSTFSVSRELPGLTSDRG